MGTELARRGVASIASANLSNPRAVSEIHNEYFNAGGNVAITNTLTLNRIYIESHGIDIDVKDINVAGAAIARECANGKGFVLGNLSSTGQMLEPYGTYAEADFVAAFKEQAFYLQDGGVDGFIIETVFDLREALCALRAIKELGMLKCRLAGARIVGGCCGTTPDHIRALAHAPGFTPVSGQCE
jgi:5-methyltetrahydrofolate--homocysteine methyltransferase